MSTVGTTPGALSAAELAVKIGASDYSGCSATVVGYGNMGRQYVRALQKLGVRHICVCSPSSAVLEELRNEPRITVLAGKYRQFTFKPEQGELGIVAVRIADLVGAACHLANCGYKKLLIEKPVSLSAGRIDGLASDLESRKVDAACAYNRVAYPSFHEALFQTNEDGGITSCTYTFTEFVNRIGPGHFSSEELQRWGIANSLHVMSMAHGLIGLPKTWSSHRTGAISWHPSGSVFVGSGISTKGIPYAYHADWGSTGRWSVEVHTRKASYRLCPLESLFRKSSGMGEWEEIPLVSFAPEVKPGFVEQLAAVLLEPSARFVAMLQLRDVAELTRYGEEIFGYQE